MQSSKNSSLERKALLLKTIGKIVKECRIKKGKGILLHAYEYDISSSSLNFIERGVRDVQITTLWKIANSFDMSFEEFIRKVEKELPENFTLIEDSN